MSNRTLAILLTVASAVPIAALTAAPTLADGHKGATRLDARAILPADATAPAPFPGVPDTDPAPAPGSTQPVGGFSALLDAPGKDNYWAMPDNGFGNKANSRSFLLRVYRVRAEFETAKGGDGEVEILDWITLRDPGERVPFEIVTEGTGERLLTGGDFDIESVRVDRRGELWFGDEFGPFLLHTDATGKVLEAPFPLPDVKSPDYPPDFPAPFDGPANRTATDGTLAKRRVVDLLQIADPARISLPARPGDIGLGEEFAMPYVTIESVLPLGGERLAIVNDTNFGSLGRNPSLPDYSDFILVRAPALRGR